MKILICGDVVGKTGRRAVKEHLPDLRQRLDLDFVVVNGENAAHGFGITDKICEGFYDAGADVPQPWAHEGNAVLMGYVGDEETPASHLREAALDGGEARPLFDLLIDNIRLFLACNVIHGDLSAYNILYWEGQITIIDFAQAVDPRTGTESMNFLYRDVERLCDFFRPFGVDASAGAVAARLWDDFMHGRF